MCVRQNIEAIAHFEVISTSLSERILIHISDIYLSTPGDGKRMHFQSRMMCL